MSLLTQYRMATPRTTVRWHPSHSQELLCPITHELMRDPVLATDGHTYERGAIENWFQRHQTSPMTNQPLTSKTVFPNHAIKSLTSREQRYLRRGKSYRYTPFYHYFDHHRARLDQQLVNIQSRVDLDSLVAEVDRISQKWRSTSPSTRSKYRVMASLTGHDSYVSKNH